jgi:hypothetical protein
MISLQAGASCIFDWSKDFLQKALLWNDKSISRMIGAFERKPE